MPKTVPRMGKQNFLQKLQTTIKLVEFKSLSPAELLEEMKEENQRRSTDLYGELDGWVKFVRADKNRSLQIIDMEGDKSTLTQAGEKLAEADNFEKAAFNLLVEKSRENFTYFTRLLTALDEKLQKQSYNLGRDLIREVEELMTRPDESNEVSAGVFAWILRDFNLVNQDEEGRWQLDPSRYNELRGEPTDLVLGLLRENNNEIPLSQLENTLITTFGWDENQVDDVVTKLNDDEVRIVGYENKQMVQKID